MKNRLALAAVLGLAAACTSTPQGSPMGFFVTSTGSGRGADFGGIEGADRHCQSLAQAAGVGQRKWRAYLSTTTADARGRIGNGPWRNAKGDVIATSVDDLHGANNKLTKRTALTEKGDMVKGRGDQPNEHDILTGSTPDGRSTGATCNNWTSSGEGSATVGHHDRLGLNESAEAKSWNSSHASRGCSLEALRGTGGAGLLYCFAAD
jgi:hypothetical protein